MTTVRSLTFALTLLGVFGGSGLGRPPAQAPAKQEEQGKKAADPAPAREPLPKGGLARFSSAQPCHGGPISAAAFARDGKTVATGGAGMVRVWAKATGDLVRSFPVPEPWIRELALSSDGALLAVETWNESTGDVRVFQVASGKELTYLRKRPPSPLRDGPYKPLAFSPDGSLLAGPLEGCWDVGNWARTKGIDELVRNAPCCTFSHDGTMLALSVGHLDRPGQEQTITLLDVAARRILTSWKAPFPVACLAFSPDHQTLLATPSSDRREVLVYEVKTGKLLQSHSDKSMRPEVAGFSPNGQEVIAVGTVNREDQRYAQLLAGWTARTPVQSRRDSLDVLPLTWRYTRPATLSSDGSVAALYQEAVRLVDTTRGKLLLEIKAVGARVEALAFAADGTTLTAATPDEMRVWDVATAKRLSAHPKKDHVTDPSRHGDYRAVLSSDCSAATWWQATGPYRSGVDQYASLYDVTTGSHKEWTGHPHLGIQCAALSPDGKVMAWGSRSGHVWPNRGFTSAVATEHVIRLWDVKTGEELPQSAKRKTRPIDKEPDKVREYQAAALAFAPDGTTLATVLSSPRRVVLWDVATLKKRRSFPEEKWQGATALLCYSPDGKTLAEACSDGLSLWETASATLSRRLRRDVLATSLAFSDAGKVLAVGGKDGEIELWDTLTGIRLRKYSGHRDAVTALAFARNGKILASGSADAAILTWAVTHDVDRPKFAGEPELKTEQELKESWDKLACPEAASALAASSAWVASGAVTVPFLLGQLKKMPVAPPRKSFDQLIQELDHDWYEVRQQATKELETRGTSAVRAVADALAKPLPSLEVRRRLEHVAENLAQGPEEPPLPPERLRMLRAVALLERIGTPEAVMALEKLSRQGADDPLTKDAGAARQRLLKRRPRE